MYVSITGTKFSMIACTHARAHTSRHSLFLMHHNLLLYGIRHEHGHETVFRHLGRHRPRDFNLSEAVE
jgi:hypothetical protein